MIKFNSVKSKTGTQIKFVELLTTVYDLPKEMLPMFNFSNTLSATSTNDAKTSAIILDYDDGRETMQGFINKHKDFKYFIYTTASHSKVKDKFRVVIPLRNWYSYSDIAVIVKNKFEFVDPCTITPCRRFYWPSKYNADGTITLRKWVDDGKAFDDIYDIKSEIEFYDFLEGDKETFGHAFNSTCDCSTFEHVKAYLNTPYPQIKGNGGASMYGLFSSICACVKYNDSTTLEKVIAKAKAEHWSDKEIDRIVKKANKLTLEKS